jgi:ribose transport system substrate-binding protein
VPSKTSRVLTGLTLTMLMFLAGWQAPASSVNAQATASPAAGQGAEQHCVPTSPNKVAEWCNDGQPLEITVVLATTEHSFYNTVGLGAKAAGEDFGVKVNVQGAKEFSAVAEAPVLNAVIQTKPDAMIAAAADPKGLDEQYQSAAEAGIAVFTVQNDVFDKSLRVTRFGDDAVATASYAADVMAQAIGGKGKVIVLSSSPGPDVERNRIEGFMNGIEKYPDIEVLPTQYCTFDPTRCAGDVSALLAAHPDLKGIFAVGEPMGVGAGTAVRTAGADVIVGAYDASPAQQRDLRDHVVDYLIVSHPYEMGYEGVRIVSEYLQGKETSDSPVYQGGSLSQLPPDILSTVSVAVFDPSICPSDLSVTCGTLDNPDVSKWLYQG